MTYKALLKIIDQANSNLRRMTQTHSRICTHLKGNVCVVIEDWSFYWEMRIFPARGVLFNPS